MYFFRRCVVCEVGLYHEIVIEIVIEIVNLTIYPLYMCTYRYIAGVD